MRVTGNAAALLYLTKGCAGVDLTQDDFDIISLFEDGHIEWETDDEMVYPSRTTVH